MHQTRTTNPEKVGLPYWMDRVLDVHSKAGGELAEEPVHDLRVALRRCILIAEIMRELDPGSDWKSLRKVGRRLFSRLGGSRDAHMLAGWVVKLGSPDDPTTAQLLESLTAENEKDHAEAKDAVSGFDRKQWRAWMREFSSHYRHVVADRPACESLLIEMWNTALVLHRRAQKSRSRVAYHRLRVGLKKFRYAVENFLPSMYQAWAPDLKFAQDVLGEMHDLSVLRQAIAKNKRVTDQGARSAWIKTLDAEWSTRLQKYRAKMSGKNSLLRVWREGLAADRELRFAGLSQLAEWGYFLTPDFARVRRIAKLALQLHDGFANCGLAGRGGEIEERPILHAAALLQEVGHFKKDRAHHKESYRMIRDLPPPPGWTKRDLQLVALVARFHRRALPRPDHKILRAYEFPLRQSVIQLAAILRFANALDARHHRAVRRLDVEDCAGVIVVRAEGLSDGEPLGAKLSTAKRLLEFAFQRPVHILAPGARMMSPRILRPATRIDAA